MNMGNLTPYIDLLDPLYKVFSFSQLELILQAYVPNQLSSYVKTNIYTVDTFLVTAAVTLIVFLLKIFHKIMTDILLGNTKYKGGIKITVEPTTPGNWNDMVVNVHYKAISWLVSEKVKEKRRGSYFMKPDLGIHYSSGEPPFFNILPKPDEANQIDIMHGDHWLKVVFVEKNEPKPQEYGPIDYRHTMPQLPSIIISTDAKTDYSVDDMATFLTSVTKSYIDYEKEQHNKKRNRYKNGAKGCWNRVCPLQDIKGLENVALKIESEELLERDLQTFINNKELYQRIGVPFRRGIMLHGKPGTGKTSLVNAIAAKLNRDLYFCNLKDIASDSELLSAFSNLPANCIVVFEDVDTQSDVLHNRQTRAEETPLFDSVVNSFEERKDIDIDGILRSSLHQFSLATMLTVLDGHTLQEGIVFIMTTNHLEVLDPAVVRPGRMDLCLELGYCTHYQIQKMFRMVMNDSEGDINSLLQGFNDLVPENLLAPCEVMQLLVLYRESPELIGEKLLELVHIAQNQLIQDELPQDQLQQNQLPQDPQTGTAYLEYTRSILGTQVRQIFAVFNKYVTQLCDGK